MSFSQIIEGWKNRIIPAKEIKEAIQETADFRMAICNDCPFHSSKHKTLRPDVHCTSCGCTLGAKVRCLSCSCPEDKWEALITDEQRDKIREHE
jgi:hypothetical protein